jgi:lipopolysaccharide export system permease protein
MSDLELTLYDGNSQDVPTNNPDELQRLYFNVDVIRVRGVGNQFQKTTTDSYKSDREMTVCEMQAAQDRARADHALARKDFLATVAALKKSKAKLSKEIANENPNPPWDIGLGRVYCRAIAAIASLGPKTAHAQGVASTTTQGRPRLGRPSKIQPAVVASSTPSNAASSTPRNILSPVPAPQSPDAAAEQATAESLRLRMEDSSQLMNAYGVEIHKKFALAVACFVFVLLGAPIALRFPRGGVGLTIGVSLFVFALYYVCLIAGESLGKRGLMPAVLSMWMANVIFAAIALAMLAKMGREGSTARGGDMREMFDSIRGWVRSKVGRKKAVVQPERAAA